MFLPRAISVACRSASEQFPVLLLTGPRRVGKTTLLRRLAEKGRRYVTLDDPAARALAQSDPALFLQRFAPPVLIDEIQYAPQLLPLIKIAVDERTVRRPSFWLVSYHSNPATDYHFKSSHFEEHASDRVGSPAGWLEDLARWRTGSRWTSITHFWDWPGRARPPSKGGLGPAAYTRAYNLALAQTIAALQWAERNMSRCCWYGLCPP